MSLTIGKLKDTLKNFGDDKIIVNHEGLDFIHLSSFSDGDLIMSVEKPIGYCKRSSGYVFPTSVEDYLGVVPEIDENVDLGEIDLPILADEVYPNKFGEAIDRESKYKKPFYLLLKEMESKIPSELWDKLQSFDIDLENNPY